MAGIGDRTQRLLLLTLVTIGLAAGSALAGGSFVPPQQVRDHADSFAGDFRLPEFVGREDPTTWSVDAASGAAYRRATNLERATNGWAEGTFLVEVPGLSDARAGTTEALAVALPRKDAEAVTLALEHVASERGAAGAVTHLDAGTETLPPPLYHRYVGVLRGAPGEATAVGILASATAGVAGQGLDHDRLVSLRGSEDSWVLEEMTGAPADRHALVLVVLTQGASPGCSARVLVPVDLCDDDGRATEIALPSVNVCVAPKVLGYPVDTCDPTYYACGPSTRPQCEFVCTPRRVLVDLYPCHPGESCMRLHPLQVVYACRDASKPACSDGKDNDGDGRTDYPNDPGCTSPSDDSEDDPVARYACDDGKDNDGDGWTDYPQDPGCSSQLDNDETTSRTTRAVGLMGEIKWCTNRASNWGAILQAIGDELEVGYDANGAVLASPYHAFSHCWTASSSSAATSCDTYGGCTDGSGHPYPYNGCDGRALCYLEASWDDVAHSRQHSNFVGLHNAQAVHEGVSTSESGDGLCGLGRYPPSGASMATDDRSRCRNYVSTHELGHNYGAQHDNGWCAAQEGKPGVMAYDSSRGNFFCDANRIVINDCMRSTTYGCPRSGTG